MSSRHSLPGSNPHRRICRARVFHSRAAKNKSVTPATCLPKLPCSEGRRPGPNPHRSACRARACYRASAQTNNVIPAQAGIHGPRGIHRPSCSGAACHSLGKGLKSPPPQRQYAPREPPSLSSILSVAGGKYGGKGGGSRGDAEKLNFSVTRLC